MISNVLNWDNSLHLDRVMSMKIMNLPEDFTITKLYLELWWILQIRCFSPPASVHSWSICRGKKHTVLSCSHIMFHYVLPTGQVFINTYGKKLSHWHTHDLRTLLKYAISSIIILKKNVVRTCWKWSILFMLHLTRLFLTPQIKWSPCLCLVKVQSWWLCPKNVSQMHLWSLPSMSECCIWGDLKN